MMEKTNYIIHLNKAFEFICNDQRLTPFHVSLYFGLFQYWNIAKFRNPISISRDEMMRAAKIGSVNTYIRCIKELDAWQYIKYSPSFNPQKGSLVHLYNFDKATNKPRNNDTDISANNGNKKTIKKAPDKTNETQLSPSINSSNKTNKLKQSKHHDHTRSKKTKKSSSSHRRKTTTGGKKRNQRFEDTTKNKNNSSSKKVAPKKESVSSRAEPRDEQITKYFAEKKWPPLEAEKFFNYYSSNGWLVGGKTPMKNWKAAAQNWMLNSQKFSWTAKSPAPGNLNATTDKNYNEPL